MAKPSRMRSTEPSPELVAVLGEALEHQKAGKLGEAEKIYRQALKKHPDNPDVLHMAGLFFVQAEKFSYAANLLQKVVRAKPGNAAVCGLLGEALYRDGQYEKAVAVLDAALALSPEDGVLNGFMGLSLHRLGRLGTVEDYYRRALRTRPTAEIYSRLGEILLGTGKRAEALELLSEAARSGACDYDTLVRLAMAQEGMIVQAVDTLAMAWRMNPEREEALSVLGTMLSFGLTPPEISPRMEQILMACLNSRKVNHNDLKILWYRQVFENPASQAARNLAGIREEKDFRDLMENGQVRAALFTPLFVEGVRRIMVYLEPLERLLIRLRRYYLDTIAQSSRALDPAEETFLYALSLQCFLNEFIFDESEEEGRALEGLRKKIESGAGSSAEWAIYGCYRSLAGLKSARAMAASGNPGGGAGEMLRVHVLEPLEEERLKKTIRTVGRISDRVSAQVRAQYEENPYPRWNSFNFEMPLVTKAIDRAYWKKGSVLIAGCGTGKHVLGVSVQSPDMEIVAVDLSAASLSYAARKCREYGVRNVTFLQGDILELGALGRRFDIIECGGVLHHMASPEAGLKVLAGLMAEQGQINLGLYSELARRDVVVLRDLIAEKGFPPTAQGIRACRSYVRSTPPQDFLFVKGSTDFYSLSACRDLLFHVQEVRYTIPGLRDLLASAGLRFTRFRSFGHMMQMYREAYPADPDGLNLDNWDAFERKNPGFFGAMYHFTAVRDGL